jgi:hypothetical protein
MEIKTKVKEIEKNKNYLIVKDRKSFLLLGPGEWFDWWDNWDGTKHLYMVKPYGKKEIQLSEVIGTVENNKLILWHEFSNKLTEDDKKQIVEFVGKRIEI